MVTLSNARENVEPSYPQFVHNQAPDASRPGTRILAIDPGNTETGWCIIDAHTHKPMHIEKTANTELVKRIPGLGCEHVVIEMIASYGMAVGVEVFETCVWIGRYFQAFEDSRGLTPRLIKRQPVKLHHCHTTKAKDANIAQALVDRFAPGTPNHGKGSKTAPGWFYGFKSDIWQAYALAVYAADTHSGSAS